MSAPHAAIPVVRQRTGKRHDMTEATTPQPKIQPIRTASLIARLLPHDDLFRKPAAVALPPLFVEVPEVAVIAIGKDSR